jgi:hypothetical protein
MSEERQLILKCQVLFEHRNRLLKMHHYNDGVWEILDENGMPIIQGFCLDEGIEDEGV